MGRKPEDIFTRVARHTRLATREAVIKFLDDGEHECLAWTGAFKPKVRTARHTPRPSLTGIGHPVRPLFMHMRGLTELDSLIWLRNHCGSFSCINPRHYKPIRSYRMFLDRHGFLPMTPEEAFEDNVKGIIEMLREGEDPEDLKEDCDPKEFAEAMFQMNH